MPLPNYHAARVKNPNLFSKIRVLKTLPNGIMIYGGTLKTNPSGGSQAQSYRFPISKFTVAEAKAWLKENDISYIMFEKSSTTQAFTTPVKLISKVFSFTQKEIISLIPEKILSKVKVKDEHPFFTMYSICHEGVSAPVVIEDGEKKAKKMTWTRKAIQSMRNIFTRGIKLFKGHNKDGSHSGRRVIGKVIHSFEKEMDGILHHLVIAYHPKKLVNEVKKYDVCSQEAEWSFFNIAGKWVADKIEKLTGIALESSENEMPAFSGAKRLGYIQAFTASGEDVKNSSGEDENKIEGGQNMPQNKVDNQGVTDPNQNVGGDPNNFGRGQQSSNQQNQQVNTKAVQQKALTYQDLKEAVKNMGVYPHQIFSKEDIQNDKEFVSIFNKIQILEEEKTNLEAKVNDLARTAALSTAGPKIESIIKENKVPEKLADFIKNRFEESKDSLQDLSDKGINNFVEDQTKLFQNVSKVIDPEFDMKQTEEGSEVEDGDYTKAENNELLEEDLEL